MPDLTPEPGSNASTGLALPQRSHGLIGIFARHKVAANMLMAMMILSGLVALKLLNIQFFPSADPTLVTVTTAWGGQVLRILNRR